MPKPKPTVNPRVALVDELVAVHTRLAPHEQDIKRREVLKKTIRTWPDADKCPAAISVSYGGTKGNLVVLGPRENQRSFVKGALGLIFDLLGKPKFLAACSFTLKAAEEALGEGKLATLVTEARTGSRDLTAVKAA